MLHHGRRGILGKAAAPVSEVFAVAHPNTPRIRAWTWTDATGFGTQYASPETLPPDEAKGIAFHPAGDAVAVTSRGSPTISAYPWSASGFGVRYANPVSLPSSGSADSSQVRFSPDGTVIMFPIKVSPYINAWAWSSTTGFGTKYADPAVLPTAASGAGMGFTPSGDAIAFGAYSAPFVHAYRWSSATGFGTKYANPSTNLFSPPESLAFAPTGDYIFLGTTTAGYRLLITRWSSATGFGSDLTSGTEPVTGGIVFNPVGDTVALGLGGQPGINIHPWSPITGLGTKYTSPNLGTAGSGVAWSPSGAFVIVSGRAFPFTPGVGLGTQLATTVSTEAGTVFRKVTI